MVKDWGKKAAEKEKLLKHLVSRTRIKKLTEVKLLKLSICYSSQLLDNRQAFYWLSTTHLTFSAVSFLPHLLALLLFAIPYVQPLPFTKCQQLERRPVPPQRKAMLREGREALQGVGAAGDISEPHGPCTFKLLCSIFKYTGKGDNSWKTALWVSITGYQAQSTYDHKG